MAEDYAQGEVDGNHNHIPGIHLAEAVCESQMAVEDLHD